uniref:Uncharacterized protein n=1 Tax=Candidatus Kentrum eta TaxID=2126337 RepID=A0A450VAP9_9GAMM|nr:MAG: hypothetical protein BECKH772A_GA0070896_102395 [Candidatus Kentron sp. H]VFK01850.1 MAG: hypothetical protein BECKH772B_GA0070898_102495 [Candidatus Kentron sp. H]VFK05168.1 MAG: hypothetical protein BECKH772C_GA0070978_102434 [Candidatus Kentron sp. H]
MFFDCRPDGNRRWLRLLRGVFMARGNAPAGPHLPVADKTGQSAIAGSGPWADADTGGRPAAASPRDSGAPPAITTKAQSRHSVLEGQKSRKNRHHQFAHPVWVPAQSADLSIDQFPPDLDAMLVLDGDSKALGSDVGETVRITGDPVPADTYPLSAWARSADRFSTSERARDAQ